MEITAWQEWESVSTLRENNAELTELVSGFSNTDPPSEYKLIWKDVSMQVQLHKARSHGLNKEQTYRCFENLIKRPYFLCQIADSFNCKTFLEVGTAEGLQHYTFAEYAKNNDGHVWTCDPRDVRNYEYSKKYEQETTFHMGTSHSLTERLLSENQKIDFFYIDGDHQQGMVLQDVENLSKIQSENPVWVFDDFDNRFGCYHDIKHLCLTNTNFAVYRVGDAASGNPNHQVVIAGKL